MKNTKQKTLEIIGSYIVDNFTISGTETDAEAKRSTSPCPQHGLVFILIYSGSGMMCTNEKNYNVSRGMLISIAPFQTHFFTEQSADFQYQYIAFEFDFMASFPLLLKPYVAEKIERCPCMRPDANTFKLLKDHYRQICLQYNRIDHPSRVDIVKALLYVFIAEVSYIYSLHPVNVKTTHQEQVTSDFLKLLHTFYHKERKPEFYAEKLSMSPCHLSKILKQTTGQSLFVWICEFVIKEAKILLHSTDMNISQISDQLNFPNSSYFARYFRKYAGISPMEYRKD